MFHSHFRIVAAVGALVLSVGVFAMGSRPRGDDEAVNSRIAPVARVELAAPSAAASGDRSGEQMYKTTCFACHEAGVANAPKFGDKAAWAPRLALGLDGLLKSAIAGKNAMPPRAGSNANDTELARAIVYMGNKAGGKLTEPVAK